MFDQLIGPVESDFLLKLLVALVCGLIVGGERELKRKPAGISTQSLVITGAAVFAFMSTLISGGDPARIAAQIVSGVGFLGAGIILKSEKGDRVTNVTTAASIWFSAAIGMAIGFDYYFIAVVAAIFSVLISRIPHISKLSE